MGTTEGTLKLKFQAAKFGVLSVTNHGAEAEHCTAHAHYQLAGEPREQDLGSLNWYSRSKRRALKESDSKLEWLSESPAHTHNEALENPYIDIPEGATDKDECDLCLFYVTVEPKQAYLYFAAPGWTPIPLEMPKRAPIRLTMRVRFKARGMTPFDKVYSIRAGHDNFEITEVN